MAVCGCYHFYMLIEASKSAKPIQGNRRTPLPRNARYGTTYQLKGDTFGGAKTKHKTTPITQTETM